MSDSPPPGLPAIHRRLILIIDKEGASAETEAYPIKWPSKGRILITELDTPPGKKVDVETHRIENMDWEDWFGKIFIPHISSYQQIFTVHPDRVFRRRLSQMAIGLQDMGLQSGREDLKQKAEQIRQAVRAGNRFTDLAQAFHEPAILTFAERSGFSPRHVKCLFDAEQPTNDQEHMELMIRLCQSL